VSIQRKALVDAIAAQTLCGQPATRIIVSPHDGGEPAACDLHASALLADQQGAATKPAPAGRTCGAPV